MSIAPPLACVATWMHSVCIEVQRAASSILEALLLGYILVAFVWHQRPAPKFLSGWMTLRSHLLSSEVVRSLPTCLEWCGPRFSILASSVFSPPSELRWAT